MTTHSKMLAALSIGLAFALASVAHADTPAATSEAGTWQKHEILFRFLGFTSTYSCDGLADQLKRLLIASGARADARADPGACASSFGRPDKFANAKLTFFTLAPAAAGATGEAAGTWRSVSIGEYHPTELQRGDCELVEQFRDEVLKKMFTIRNLGGHTTCVPHQESGSTIDLRFEVLAAAPGAAVPAATAAAPNIFVYPKSGQSKEQQAKDRAECNSAAVAQSGYDPSQPGASGAAGKSTAYVSALRTCLEPRGYTVR